MGHMLVGLAARLDTAARTKIMSMASLGGLAGAGLSVAAFRSSTRSTGLEILTWVGDLGGATGRLALDRAEAAAKAKPGSKPTPVQASKYFSGLDYGGPSNLLGDIYAYALAPASASGVDRPAIGAPLLSPATVKDAFQAFFLSGSKGAKSNPKAGACRAFLAAIGGTLAAGSLTNKAALATAMADKFEAFGDFYMYSYLKTFAVKPPPPPPRAPKGAGLLGKLERLGQEALDEAKSVAGAGWTIRERHNAAVPFLRQAAEDVAALFMTKLLANRM
jgi:hypothetical protein